MKTATVHIDDLHFDHLVWKNELKFFGDELKIYTKRLEEIAKRYTSLEVLSELEHYQNQFILNKEVFDTLLHEVNACEQELVKGFKENPKFIDHVRFEDHTSLREKIETNRTMFAALKKDFMKYLTKWA